MLIMYSPAMDKDEALDSDIAPEHSSDKWNE